MRREFRESAVKVPRFPRARHRVCCVPYINGLPVKVHKCMRTDDLVIPPRDTRSRSRNGTDDLREFFARIDRKEQHVTFGPRRAKCIADRFTGLWKLARCREGNKSANSAKNRWGNFSLLSCEKNQSNDRNERETFEMRNQIAKFLNQCHISSLFLSLSLSLSFSLSLSLSLSLLLMFIHRRLIIETSGTREIAERPSSQRLSRCSSRCPARLSATISMGQNLRREISLARRSVHEESP
jgi:hypothetical protein